MYKEDNNRIIELVKKVMAGDSKSWDELYTLSYRSIHYIAMDFMKNEEDAADAEQEAYIKMYNSISTLSEPSKFNSWSRQITANTCKDMLRKRREYTFSDIQTDDTEDIELEIEDLNIDFKPEEQMDAKETSRLVREMLGELPEEQRISLDLLYGSQLSVKEIADIMECSENTVKSRLKYGRDAIEEKVEALKRQGTKLYLIPVATLIHMAYRTELQTYAAVNAGEFMAKILGANAANTAAISASSEAAASSEASMGVEAAASSVTSAGSGAAASSATSVGAEAAASSTASATAVTATATQISGTAGAVASKVIGGKLVAMIAAGAVAVGAVTGGVIAYKNYNHKKQVAKAESLFAAAQELCDEGNYEAALENLNLVKDMDVLDGIDIDSNIADTKLRIYEDELYSKAVDDFNALDQTDKDSLSEWLDSDSVEEYFDISGNNAIWVPSDTGDNVTGYFKNGGIYKGSADKGIRTGEGKWSYGDKTYTGSWSNDKPNGTGTYGYATSNYTGTFVDGIGNGAFEADWSMFGGERFPINVVNGDIQVVRQEIKDGKPRYIIYETENVSDSVTDTKQLIVEGLE